MFKDQNSYAIFFYTLENKYPEIQNTKIKFFKTSSNKATAYGKIYFENEIVLNFREFLDFSKKQILDYSYEVIHSNEKLNFYDPQPHPDDPNLASTFPHHKHVPLNIKRNRQPAPGLSFNKPNLPFLVQEIIDDLL